MVCVECNLKVADKADMGTAWLCKWCYALLWSRETAASLGYSDSNDKEWTEALIASKSKVAE
jgi:hypothetical protein